MEPKDRNGIPEVFIGSAFQVKKNSQLLNYSQETVTPRIVSAVSKCSLLLPVEVTALSGTAPSH